jgi:hypothetical protein
MVSPAATLATQESQLTRLSAGLSAQPLQKSLYRVDGIIDPGQGLQSQQYIPFQSKGLLLGTQALHHLSHTPSSFALSLFFR